MSNSHTCVICQKGINTETQGYQAFSTGSDTGAMVHNTCASYLDEGVQKMSEPSKTMGTRTRKSKDEFDTTMDEFRALPENEKQALYQKLVDREQGQEYTQRISKAGNLPTALPVCHLCNAPIFGDEKSMVLKNRHGGDDIMHDTCLAEKLSVGNNGQVGSYSKQRAIAANKLRMNK